LNDGLLALMREGGCIHVRARARFAGTAKATLGTLEVMAEEAINARIAAGGFCDMAVHPVPGAGQVFLRMTLGADLRLRSLQGVSLLIQLGTGCQID